MEKALHTAEERLERRREREKRNKRLVVGFMFKNMTLRELGKEEGISHERVRQILTEMGIPTNVDKDSKKWKTWRKRIQRSLARKFKK